MALELETLKVSVIPWIDYLEINSDFRLVGDIEATPREFINEFIYVNNTDEDFFPIFSSIYERVTINDKHFQCEGTFGSPKGRDFQLIVYPDLEARKEFIGKFPQIKLCEKRFSSSDILEIFDYIMRSCNVTRKDCRISLLAAMGTCFKPGNVGDDSSFFSRKNSDLLSEILAFHTSSKKKFSKHPILVPKPR